LTGQVLKRALQFVVRQAIDFSASDETAPNRFVDCQLQLATVHVFASEQIDNRSQRARHPHAVDLLNVATLEMRPVKNQNLRNRAAASKSFATVMCSFDGIRSESS